MEKSFIFILNLFLLNIGIQHMKSSASSELLQTIIHYAFDEKIPLLVATLIIFLMFGFKNHFIKNNFYYYLHLAHYIHIPSP